jgi:hypothetical protein
MDIFSKKKKEAGNFLLPFFINFCLFLKNIWTLDISDFYPIKIEGEILGFKISIFVFNWLLSERFAPGNSQSRGSKNGKSKYY